ncbi:MAG: Rab family GTPase [Pseudohongiellaceae bacterium]
MIKLKVCMIGAYAVGKTSLVERYVRSLYSDDYHTTIGVKIDKKELTVDDKDVTCMLWDIAGEDEFYTVNHSYLRGMAGYFLVVDGTRPASVETATRIQERIELLCPDVPFMVLANKADLEQDWVVSGETLAGISYRPYEFFRTSAKSGDNVESAFEQLARQMLNARKPEIAND